MSPCLFNLYVEWSEVKWSEVRLCDPVDCSPPGSSVHGIFQARILEWVAISFMRNAGLDEAGINLEKGEISITLDMQMTPPLRQKGKN